MVFLETLSTLIRNIKLDIIPAKNTKSERALE